MRNKKKLKANILIIGKFGEVTDGIVGVFMILLGIYGLFKAKREFNRSKTESNSLVPTAISTSDDDAAVTIELPPIGKSKDYAGIPTSENEEDVEVEHNVLLQQEETRRRSSSAQLLQMQENTSTIVEGKVENEEINGNKGDIEEGKVHDVQPRRKCCNKLGQYFNLENESTQKIAALCIGIVHGIAGPGGILGVLPAVGLHNWVKSVIYLGSFCGTSILIMGMFAALYGEATGRLSRDSHVLAYRMSVVSSMLSVVVGILWIILLLLGKLQKVFG